MLKSSLQYHKKCAKIERENFGSDEYKEMQQPDLTLDSLSIRNAEKAERIDRSVSQPNFRNNQRHNNEEFKPKRSKDRSNSVRTMNNHHQLQHQQLGKVPENIESATAPTKELSRDFKPTFRGPNKVFRERNITQQTSSVKKYLHPREYHFGNNGRSTSHRNNGEIIYPNPPFQHFPWMPINNYLNTSALEGPVVEIRLTESDHDFMRRKAMEEVDASPMGPELLELQERLTEVWAAADEMMTEQRDNLFRFYEAVKQLHIANWLKSQSAEDQRLYLDRTKMSISSVC